MDRNHRLDAPNNSSLEDIEQIADRSDLSSLYFKGHKEWEGKELVSDEERQARRDKEQRDVMRSICKHFFTLGLLIPTPVISLVLLISLAAVFLNPDNLRYMLPGAILAVLAWGILTYVSTRKVYAIFYDHALQATPFIIIMTVLLGLSAQASFLATRSLHGDSLATNIALVSAGVYGASVLLSIILLSIWTSPRLNSQGKIGAIVVVTVALLGIISGLILL